MIGTLRSFFKPRPLVHGIQMAIGPLDIVYHNRLAKIASFLRMIPPPGKAVETAVYLTPGGYWIRSFGGFFMTTQWKEFKWRGQPRLAETFGPFSFCFEFDELEDNITWKHSQTLLFDTIPLPLFFFNMSIDMKILSAKESWHLSVRTFIFQRAFFEYSGLMTRSYATYHPLLHFKILFDGHCVMCNSSIDFVMKRDPRPDIPLFKVAAIQSAAGQNLLFSTSSARDMTSNPDKGFQSSDKDPPVINAKINIKNNNNQDLNDLSSVRLLSPRDELFTGSDAPLLIATQLRWPWPLLGWLGFGVPKRFRDPLYYYIGRNRIKWFGNQETCRRPSQRDQQFFL